MDNVKRDSDRGSIIINEVDGAKLVLFTCNSSLPDYLDIELVRQEDGEGDRVEWRATLPIQAVERLSSGLGLFVQDLDTDFLE